VSTERRRVPGPVEALDATVRAGQSIGTGGSTPSNGSATIREPDDCRRTYDELKERGVTFTEEHPNLSERLSLTDGYCRVASGQLRPFYVPA